MCFVGTPYEGTVAMRLARLLTAAVLGLAGLSVTAGPATAASSTVTRIFYLADSPNQRGVQGLYSRDLDGSNVRQLVRPRSGRAITSAQVSPDGTTVAYELVDRNYAQLWLIDSGGGHNRRVHVWADRYPWQLRWTSTGSVLRANPLRADARVDLLSPGATDSDPWASQVVPHSERVFDAAEDGQGGYVGTSWQGGLVRWAGSAPQALLAGVPKVGFDGVHSGTPVATTDGGTIVYAHLLNTRIAQPPVADLEALSGTKVTTLATGDGNVRPSLGPGGTVYFEKDDLGQSDLWSVPIDGSAAPSRLTSTEHVSETSVSASDVPTTFSASEANAGAPSVALDGTTPEITVPGERSAAPVDHLVCRTAGTTAPTAPCADPIFDGRVTSSTTFNDHVSLGQTYTYTNFVTDVYGNVGPSAGSQSMQAVGVRVVASNPTAIGTTSSPFRVVWGQLPAPQGATYEVTYSLLSPTSNAWSGPQPWLAATTATSFVFGAAGAPTIPRYGDNYEFQVVPIDAYGNRGYPVGSGHIAVPYDQSAAAHGAGWKTLNVNDRWEGSEATTTTNGATTLIRLTGYRLSVIGDRCLTCGDLQVYVDGVLKDKVSTYYVRSQTRQVLWSGAVVPGRHSLRVTAVVSKQRPRVSLDAFAAER